MSFVLIFTVDKMNKRGDERGGKECVHSRTKKDQGRGTQQRGACNEGEMQRGNVHEEEAERERGREKGKESVTLRMRGRRMMGRE